MPLPCPTFIGQPEREEVRLLQAGLSSCYITKVVSLNLFCFDAKLEKTASSPSLELFAAHTSDHPAGWEGKHVSRLILHIGCRWHVWEWV